MHGNLLRDHMYTDYVHAVVSHLLACLKTASLIIASLIITAGRRIASCCLWSYFAWAVSTMRAGQHGRCDAACEGNV